MVSPDKDTIDPVLLELERSASDADRSVQWPDQSDWRCSRALNWIRTYGLLVRLASALTLAASAVDRRGSSKSQPNAESLEEALRLLGAFARTVTRTPRLTEFDRGTRQALRSARDLATSLRPSPTQDGVGAYLGEEWRQPVPATLQGFLSCMAWPSKPAERQAALQKVLDGPDCHVAELLDEANIGIASAVHLALTFDDRGSPNPPVDADLAYQAAALVRVLAAHRVLLETIGIDDPLVLKSLFGMAERIAQSTTFAAFFIPDATAQAYLKSSREGDIATLEAPGRIEVKARDPLSRKKISTAEKEVLQALEAVIHSSK